MAERPSELENRDALETGVFEADSTDKTSLQKRDGDYALAAESEAADEETGEETSDEAEQIREQIVETRRGMSETIDAIQEKLSFSNISEQVQTQVSEQINSVVETAKDAFYGKTTDVVNTVSRGLKDFGNTDLMKKAQQNPTALALIGAGIGALLVGVLAGGGKKKRKNAKHRDENESYNYDYGYNPSFNDDEVRFTSSARRELKSSAPAAKKSKESTVQTAKSKVGGTASSAYQTVATSAASAYEGVSGTASSVSETVSDVASRTYEGVSGAAGKTYQSVGNLAGKTYETVGDAAGYTYDKAGELGGQMKVNYDYYIEENPLAVGALALAIGAAIGFAIPLTKKENEYLGEYRDQVLEKAQATAQEAIGSVKQMATEAQKAITEEVKSKTA